MARRVLVLFGTGLPKGGFSGYDTVIAPRHIESEVRGKGLSFTDIDTLVSPGSVQEASEFARKLSLLTTLSGQRVSKVVNYKGYELWWMHYDDLYYKFCLPFTQYRALLESLKGFDSAYLYKPPAPGLFAHFLDAHKVTYRIFEDGRPFSFGLLLQALMSMPFLLWLVVRRPKLMMWTSDQFDGPRDYDFRMRLIYEELRRKKLYFVEFIRSVEQTPTVLRHALERKRAVLYSFAIVALLRSLAGLFGPKRIAGVTDVGSSAADHDQEFWFLVATHYLRHLRGDLWSIGAMTLIVRCIGIRVAIIDTALSRNFHEVMACKLLNIPTVGILHGFASKDYNVYDFMPEFTGDKILSVDKYGLWSEWWKQYYLKNSKAYQPEQLYVSGPMRPFQKTHSATALRSTQTEGPLKVLFVSEQLGVPSETVPYLLALLEARDLSVYVSFRSNRDGFETWLKEHRPDILKKIDPANIFRSGIHEGLAHCDVAAGSHSTAVLEALFYDKPPVFFKSKKWGDYFELKSLSVGGGLLAGSPQEFVDLIRRSKAIPQETLQELQHRFFGDPHMNGSAWVVEEAEKLL